MEIVVLSSNGVEREFVELRKDCFVCLKECESSDLERCPLPKLFLLRFLLSFQ